MGAVSDDFGRGVALALWCAAAAVLAQEGPRAPPPEDEWSAPAFPDRAADAPPELPPAPALPPPPLVSDEGGQLDPDTPDDDGFVDEPYRPPPPPPPLDAVTLFTGRTLGKGRQAVALTAGYPYVGLRYARGFWDRVDLGVSVATFYGMMTEARLEFRWEPLRAGGLSLGVVGGAGGALFLRSALQEGEGGARWVTGRRHVNGDLGLVISGHSPDGRGLQPFLDLRYLLAADLAPVQSEPLGGIPPDFSLAGNTLIRVGAELPLSSRAGLIGSLGLDLHGRREDAVFLINLSFGVLVSF